MITLQAGVKMDNGAYKNATIVHVFKNGWCKCKWDDGKEFKARAHWLCGVDTEYKLIPTT